MHHIDIGGKLRRRHWGNARVSGDHPKIPYEVSRVGAHTPSPMTFLSRVLDRPESERPFILFPIGYPAKGCEVPDLVRKDLAEVMVVHS